MTTKSKPVIREPKPDHPCSKELVLARQASDLRSQTRAIKRNTVLLNRLSKVSLGNGHEEDGLLFVVRKFVNEHAVVLTDIHDIKEKLGTVTEINTELEVQRRVQAEKEKLIREARENLEIKLKKRTFTWSKIPVIVAILSLIVLTIFSILNYNINRKTATKEDVKSVKDDLGQPVVITSRGEIGNLPKGDSIKYFRNMEYQNFKDTTKK
jgi:hypothetical protein